MLLNVRDAAALLNTTERQLYRWVDDEAIPFQRIREEIRFNRSELLEWATNRRLPVSAHAFDSDDPQDAAPSLVDALLAGGVHPGVNAQDRDDAIRRSLELVPLPESVDRELVVELMLAREAAGSTAVGHGIAMPHVRHPIVAPGSPPLVAVVYLAKAISFDAPDREPVHTIVLIVSPTVRGHLQMLARVAGALSDRSFRAAIDGRASLDGLCHEAAELDAQLGTVARAKEIEGSG
jgi:PTS system nitrogen regulatory IIA component